MPADYTISADYLGVMGRILEDPDDDASRLILADVIEDAGDEQTAIALRRLVQNPMRENISFVQVGDRRLCGSSSRGFFDRTRLSCDYFFGKVCEACDGEGTIHNDMHYSPDTCGRCHGKKRFDGIAKDLFLKYPVIEVFLGDKRPSEWAQLGDEREWVFERDNSDHPEIPESHYLGAGPFNPGGNPRASRIPFEIFDHMKGREGGYYFAIKKVGHLRFDTKPLAMKALSDACVSYGRHLAGLPDLEAIRRAKLQSRTTEDVKEFGVG